MIKLIIFDIGGVLEDFRESMYAAYICKKLKLDVNKFRKSLERLLLLAESGKITCKQMLSEIATEFGVSVKSLEWSESLGRLAKRNDDVILLLNRLSARYRIVLLTNISRSRYISTINAGLLDGVKRERVFASCYLKMAKPDPKIYRYVLNTMGSSAAESVFIDDRIENVKGAKSVGIKSVHFRNYKKLVSDLKKLGVSG
jgi:putative hydrolase of the HAD superfamily